ncbi:ATP-binding cassette domain-containing protein [Rhodococcus sp. RDE2]|uniref:ATP-binding cassette domain-containing protein n=1 Tax=Rhodococcus sp. RDE2 TaxID=2885078 RepID=UPI001E60ED04|nr:ABC transporter ATP-binding protein [Rhodococcus sp. RDE2]
MSFRIDEGEVFGFLGPNGAGKSTTIRILLGLYPTSGQVRVFGLDPTREASRILARVGYLPGELALYPQLTGGQLLDRFARMRGLSDLRYRDELVDRFGAELDRPARTLSKGNRQKIGLVMAFMHRPDYESGQYSAAQLCEISGLSRSAMYAALRRARDETGKTLQLETV